MYCFVCCRRALMGFHPLCVLQLARIKVAGGPMRATVCRHCPFRRDRPFWLDQGRKVLNVLRLKYGSGQQCHMQPTHECRGVVIAAAGGDSQVLSAAEFAARKPCELREMEARYHAGSTA